MVPFETIGMSNNQLEVWEKKLEQNESMEYDGGCNAVEDRGRLGRTFIDNFLLV